MRAPKKSPIRRSIPATLVVATLATGFAAVATPQAAWAADACGSTNGLALGTGTDTRMDVEADQATIKADALAQVKKWRQDALDDTSVLWNGQTMKAYLASAGISQTSYLNPQWDYNLERIAMQRTAETSIDFDHTRPNGTSWWSLTSNGESTDAEIIAAGTSTIGDAVSMWAGEKDAYVKQTQGAVTGHYTTLINPSYLSYGFGNTAGYAVGEASSTTSTNTAATGWSGTCEFRIPLLAKDLASVTMSPTSAIAGQTKAITTTVTVNGMDDWQSGQVFTLTANGALSSASTNVASVSGSSLVARAAGTSAITMSSGDQSLKLGTFTVAGNTITSLDSTLIIVSSGTAPTLPATVQAHWADGTTTTVPVSWGSIPTTWKNRQGGTFTVNGTVNGTSRLAVATVTVKPAGVTKASVPATTTPAGVAPTLPTSASVTWSNGDTSNETVTWDAVPASSYAHPGSFVATGHLSDGTSVQDAVTVTNPVVTSVATAQASTLPGVAPTLPSTDAVTWSDGSTTQESVSWSLDASQYAKPGTSTVSGVVTLPDGSTKPATLTLTVGTPGFSAAQGTAPAATGLIGEATGDTMADLWALDGNGTLDFYRYGSTVQKLGVRGQGLTQITYMAPVTDQNGDKRADILYRDSTDQSLWFAYNRGNGYLDKGIKIGTHWGGMDQIFYAGTMVAGSTQQYVLARRAGDGTLWRYNLDASGLSHGVQVGTGWGGMRVMFAPGNVSGDAAWDVVAITNDGLMYSYESRGGNLVSKGVVGHGWGGMTNAFSPGDITGDGRLDLMGQRSDGTLWAYANKSASFVGLGQVGSGFGSYRLMA